MEIGRKIVVDVSEATIYALKVVAVICLLLLCAQIVKAMQPIKCNGNCGKNKVDMFANKPMDNKKESDHERENERKYWKKVRDDLGKEESSNEKEKNRIAKMVSDKNIKIRKKPEKVAPVIRPIKPDDRLSEKTTQPRIRRPKVKNNKSKF